MFTGYSYALVMLVRGREGGSSIWIIRIFITLQCIYRRDIHCL